MRSETSALGVKKIFISLVSLVVLFSLASCGVEQEVDIVEKTENKVTQNNIEDQYLTDKKVSFEDLKNNLLKLENIGLEDRDLERINFELKNMYNSFILNKAKEKGDVNICKQLEQREAISCKRNVILNLKDETKCSLFGNTGAINNCKNSINRELAQENLDVSICNSIIDNSEEKFEINSCKNKIFFSKAIKNIDINICNQISDKNEKEICIEIVNIEEENKKLQKVMEKEEELLKSKEVIENRIN